MSKRKRRSKSGYHRNRKAETADRYGQFANGKRLTPDVIAGRKVGGARDE
jgi:hypothetical protein